MHLSIRTLHVLVEGSTGDLVAQGAQEPLTFLKLSFGPFALGYVSRNG
jgi:hypothetical protein